MAQRSIGTRLAIHSAGLLLGILGAVASLYFGIGPTSDIKCGDQSAFERAFFGDRLGAIDGVDYSGCATPAFGAYVVAGVVGLGMWGVVILMSDRGNSRVDRPS